MHCLLRPGHVPESVSPELCHENIREARSLNIIDALREGFEATNRRLWLLIFPAGLDFWLWLGPRVSAQPVIHKAVNGILAASGSLPNQDWYSGVEGFLKTMESLNLSLLLTNELIGWPSFVATAGQLPLPKGWTPPTAVLSNAGTVLIVSLGFFVLGILLAAAYFKSVVIGLPGGNARRLGIIEGIANAWLQGILYVLLLVLLVLMLSIPVSIFVAFLTIISPSLGMASMGVLLLFLSWAFLGIMILLAFVMDAVVWDDISVLQGVVRSLRVVMRNFWSTFGLILLSNILVAGFGVIWERLAHSLVGVAAGILGNAYIGTGVIAASLIFYRDRYDRWLAEAKQISEMRDA